VIAERFAIGALAAAALLGCHDGGTIPIALPLQVAGTPIDGPFEGRDGWHIALSRADVAFGPLYLCSGYQAGELCDTARAEWLGSVVIDALDPEPRRAGALEGTSGVTRSWMYDHGITSLFTQQAPLPLAAAQALGGSSVVVQGIATRRGTSLAFYASVVIQREEQTEIGVPIVRKSTSESFEHDVSGDEAYFLVRFDARPWLGDVDFSALAPGDGDEISLPADSQGFRAIKNAVVAGQRPTFELGPSTQSGE
jgi:hypothetical protein